MLPFQIYQRCSHDFVGMSGVSVGVSADTVSSVFQMFKDVLPTNLEEQRKIYDAVLFMGSVAARVMNNKRQKK